MKKYLCFIALLLAMNLPCISQEFRNDESIASQLKNNKQPGLQYAPAASQPSANKKTFTGSSLAKEMKEGKLLPVQRGGTSSVPAAAARPANVSLPSDKSAEVVQNELKAEKTVPAVLPPMQEENKGNSPAKQVVTTPPPTNKKDR